MDMIYGSDIGIANIVAMDNEECKNMFINVGTGIETSVIKLLDMMKHSMKKYIGDQSIDIVYDKHDPNLVKQRRADVTLMHTYLGKHNIDVQEGIDMTCYDLYDKVDSFNFSNA